MKNEQIDAIIDEVAGTMTAGEPRPGFTAEVMARIESGIEWHDAPRRTWRTAWTLAPLAAAAAIVVALVVFRGVHRSADTAQPQASTSVARGAQPIERGADASAPHQAEAPRTEVNVQKSAAAADTAGRGRSDGRGTERAARQTAATGTLDEPAAQVEAIDLARLAVDSLTPDSIRIERLDSIAPITVAPLDIPNVQRRFE